MSLDPDLLGPDSDEFARVAGVVASISDADTVRDQPPADLWDSIAARLGGSDSPTVIAAAPEMWATPADELPEQDAAGQADVAPVIDLDARRRGPWARVAAAAAVVIIAAGTVGVVMSEGNGTGQELVASVELEALSGPATANAELVEVDGTPVLRITLDDLGTPPDGTHYELWLIDPDVTDPRSLGEVPTGATEVEVPVPDGVDPDRYPIVDINVQEDGVEEHSGLDTSILRGTLA